MHNTHVYTRTHIHTHMRCFLRMVGNSSNHVHNLNLLVAVTLIIGIDQTLNQLNYDSSTIKNGFGSGSNDYECTKFRKSAS